MILLAVYVEININFYDIKFYKTDGMECFVTCNLLYYHFQSAELPLDLTFLSAVDISAHQDISTSH